MCSVRNGGKVLEVPDLGTASSQAVLKPYAMRTVILRFMMHILG